VPAENEKLLSPQFTAGQTDKRGAEDDDWKRHLEKMDRHECERGEAPHHFILERRAANANDGRGHDGEHRGLQTVEHGSEPREVAPGDVNETQEPKDYG
jgi:hypothetical protein